MLPHSNVRRHHSRMCDVTRLNLIKFGLQVQQTSFAPGSGIGFIIGIIIGIIIDIIIGIGYGIGSPYLSLPKNSFCSRSFGDFGLFQSRVRSFEMEIPNRFQIS